MNSQSAITERETDLASHQAFCQQLVDSGQGSEDIRLQWQRYYDELPATEKQALWHHADGNFPIISDTKDKRLSRLWSRAFYNQANLKRLANGCALYSNKGFGLIYCYLINGWVRYVG